MAISHHGTKSTYTGTYQYTCTYKYKHDLKNNLKYKHSGATGTLVGVVSIEGITVHVYHGKLQLRFQLDSDVCSADLHHNPRKHVGLHAHQRLHRLP